MVRLTEQMDDIWHTHLLEYSVCPNSSTSLYLAFVVQNELLSPFEGLVIDCCLQTILPGILLNHLKAVNLFNF